MCSSCSGWIPVSPSQWDHSQALWLHILGHFALCFLCSASGKENTRVFSAPSSPPFTNAKIHLRISFNYTFNLSLLYSCFVCSMLPFPPCAVGCAERSLLTSGFCLPLLTTVASPGLDRQSCVYLPSWLEKIH